MLNRLYIYSRLSNIIPPHAHAQQGVKQSFVQSTRKSPDLEIQASKRLVRRKNPSELSKNGLDYTSNCLMKLMSAVNTAVSDHAYRPYPHWAMCFLLMRITMQVKVVNRSLQIQSQSERSLVWEWSSIQKASMPIRIFNIYHEQGIPACHAPLTTSKELHHR